MNLHVVVGADRWRPTRAGLIALWRYWDETFTFHNGRLLLRGPNGSGKSMALELLLPFLLDGDSSPSKLTSSGKIRGRLFDRLMTGTSEQSRTGFAWVEFVRGTDVFTVGARIRGSRATNKTDVELFTTTLAVGRDLHLLDATRTPLSRKALVEAIGSTGRVHASADEHRAAVREALFPGFSAERYSSMIGALLALRKEKLSEKLDPEKLSSVLSEALPPLDDHDIAAVAEGFERLDRRRSALAELERDVDEARQLARRQRAYAQVVVVAAAAAVRSAETNRDTITRNERQACEELAEAQRRNAEVRVERDRLSERDDEIGVEIEALKDSEAYRAGAGLADLRKQAERLRALATRAAEAAIKRKEQHAAAEQAVVGAIEEHGVADTNARRADAELRSASEQVGAEQVAVEAAGLTEVDDGETLLAAWIRAQRGRVGEVRAALAAHSQAVTQREVWDEQVSAAERSVADRATALDVSEHAETAAREQFAAAVQGWAAKCSTVGVERLRAALPVLADDPPAVAAAVGEVGRALAEDDATARERLARNRETADAELSGLRAERARWESSGLVEPDRPPWRSSRGDRRGAPLWQLVDVAPGVPDSAIDGLEAALTAAGLLDAWVTPDGRIDLGPDSADVQLAARPVGGRTLRELLAPASGSIAVSASTIAAVLSSVAVLETVFPAAGDDTGELRVAVAVDGSYRLGSAFGRGPARPAMLLGAVARERYRVQRLADIDAAIGEVERRLAGLDRQVVVLDQRRAAVDAELAARPSGTNVADTVRLVTEASARLMQAREALEASQSARRHAEAAVRSALRELTTLATRHSLPADAGALADVEAALGRLVDTTAVWGRRHREVLVAARQRDTAVEAAARAALEATEAASARDDAERDAAEIEHRAHTLESSIGADYRQILDRIGALGQERETSRARVRVLAAEADALQLRVGALGEDVKAAEAKRAEADAVRERDHRRFVAALSALGGDAGTDAGAPLDTGTAVLAAARALGAAHENLDASGQAIERRSEQVRERVHVAQSALGARVDFDRELADEGWWILRTTSGGLRRRIGELADVLAAQLAEGYAELAAEEERLFEQTLAGSVRRALADRIRQARALVDGINTQLAAVRTAAAGVSVQLRWDVDPEQPPAVRAARALLLRDPADLSEQERAALQEFVRARVDQARAELEADAPWEARLRESLDYRAWHRFTLQIAHRDWDGYQPATGPRLQKLSTGERSIALHLPMIASVAAHYTDDTGDPASCPRLILLDELFAGVDAANRAQLFGAFTTWQLDAVFTSDHEWCQYADLDGIAIHYLHPPTDDEPVTSTRFTWDGTRRLIDPAVA